MRGEEVGVHGQVGIDPLETRDHAGERAHMLAEARHRGPWRNRPISPACHDQLAAGANLDQGAGARPGSRSSLRPQAGHCGRAAT